MKNIRKKKPLVVIALGGNFLNSPNEKGGYAEQLKNARKTAEKIAEAAKKYKIVITHGNGPQVGNILLQQEYSKDYVPPMPLSICGAQSQGQIGTILSESLNNEFEIRKINSLAVSVITHTLIDEKDPSFLTPSKPIGPIYTPKETQVLRKQGHILKKIMIGAYRRIAPSPYPLKILELDAIKILLKTNQSNKKNIMPIVAGGGGIPIIKSGKKLKLAEAVIDKDLSSQTLANSINADILLILTNVKGVALDFQKKEQRFLKKINSKKAKQYLKERQFPAGNMGPKVEAAFKFVENGGKRAIITRPNDLLSALKGRAGTEITK